MYTKHFGFSDKPFNVTPDPKYLYLSQAHQEALASMIYGIRERRGFILIVGEVGTGKTTLLHTLFNELEKDVKTVFIFNTRINFNQLLQNILIELELTPQGNNKFELLNQLNDFLIEKLSLGENVALIIDEAQNLSSVVLEELRMLSNLETAREKLLQITLVGQPELDAKLRSPHLRQLKQRMGISCYLTPLNNEERIKYIKHRLTVAGCDDNHIFSQKALELICNHSKGIPRIINILCDNALLSAYGKERKRIDTDIVEEVLSDYERANFPVTKEDGANNASQKVKKRTFVKLRLSTALISFLIIALLFLGVSAYRRDFNYLKNFTNNLFTKLSLLWQKPEPSPGHFTTSNNDQQSRQVITDTINDRNTFKPTTTIKTNEESDDNSHLIAGKSSLSEPASSFPESKDTPPASIEKNQKIIFAREGDMVTSLVLREYGIVNDTICDIVKRANPDIENLDRINVGQKIILPNLGIDSMIIEVVMGVFTVHIASFNSYDDAKQYLNRAVRNNNPISISPVKIAGKGLWYRVTVGNFTSRAQAIEFVKKNNLDTFL